MRKSHQYALDAGQQKPRLDDGDIRKEFADIAGDVARLHGIADRLGAMAACSSQ